MKTISIVRSIFFSFLLSFPFSVSAAEPSDYYSSCENKSGASLLSALQAKVGPHTTISYSGLYTVYAESDVRANGTIWDMYSTKQWAVSGPRCGNYSLVGDCYNREHSFPKSWFNDASPMYSDAFHIYPTDGKVNGQRSNFPYGECANGTTLPSNNGVDALGRLGTSTFPGYTGKVFEPVDEYKGDFARTYFYMAAAYNDRIASWNSDMLAGNKYPAFSTWAINLLLKWHRQDPVSQKEIDRNEAVYSFQENRNPFIDHPELAEYIWGDKTTENWTLGASSQPELSTPVDGSTISFGAVAVGKARTVNIVVSGKNLSDNISVSVSGTGFAASASILKASEVNTTDGAKLTLTCTATGSGAQSGKLTLTSGAVSSLVTLSATAYDGLPVSPATNISDCSFVAHWTYIGDEDTNGCYTINVYDASGNAVDTYPRSVDAKSESYLVDELSAETTYTYSIANSLLSSNTMTVTTSAPIPSIQLLYDGELFLATSPGTPSDAAEILLLSENISEDIVLTVKTPFELSSDKANWNTSLTLDPREDRFYLRVNSADEGTFITSITASAGDYTTDDAQVEALVSSKPSFVEDFETSAPGGYTNASFQGSAANWLMNNAGVYSGEAYEGNNSLRLGKNSTSSFTLDGSRPRGIGQMKFYAAAWRGDGEAKLDIQTSSDGGATWTTASSVTLPSSDVVLGKNSYKEYTVTINQSGVLGLRIQQTAGGRAGIDYITLSDCLSTGIDGVVSDYRSWDAFCRGGELVIDLAESAKVAVYGIDGITYYHDTAQSGETRLSLAKGLYIVLVEDFSRRVLVK